MESVLVSTPYFEGDIAIIGLPMHISINMKL